MSRTARVADPAYIACRDKRRSRGSILTDPMAKAVTMETEAVSTAKVMEEALDLVKEMDTGDRSFSEIAPTICNDSQGRPLSIERCWSRQGDQ